MRAMVSLVTSDARYGPRAATSSGALDLSFEIRRGGAADPATGLGTADADRRLLGLLSAARSASRRDS
jgi:hypothetical protein